MQETTMFCVAIFSLSVAVLIAAHMISKAIMVVAAHLDLVDHE